VSRADHYQTPCSRRKRDAECKGDHPPIGCTYECVEASDPDSIEGNSKGFSLIGRGNWSRTFSVRDVVDAQDPKLSGVDCAAQPNNVLPPAGRRVPGGRSDVLRGGDPAEHGDDWCSTRANDLAVDRRRIEFAETT